MIERFSLQYDNEQKHVPDFDGKYQNSKIGSNHLVHHYVDFLCKQTCIISTMHTMQPTRSTNRSNDGLTTTFVGPRMPCKQVLARASVKIKSVHTFAGGLQHQVMPISQWYTANKMIHRDGHVHFPALQEL